jgi:hypothetical protein
MVDGNSEIITRPEPRPSSLEDLANQETVKLWLQAYLAHWKLSPSDRETTAKLEVLGRFCAYCGSQPDELVRSLFRPTPEGPRIRLKRRREVMALIDEFEKSVADDPRQARPAGNTVRSFLIHNGVALSATPLT